MIIPDANLVLYAHINSFPAHSVARQWWTEVLNGREEVGLVPVVVFAFIRIVTNRRILEHPTGISEATAIISGWLNRRHVNLLTPGPRHLDLAFEQLRGLGAAGNLTTDAQIAAHAIEHRATVYSNDTDFQRFSGIIVVNPLTG